MKLNKVFSINLIPTSPFNFDATFHKPDHFTSGDNYWESGVRWQTWQWKGHQIGLKFIDVGLIEKPEIKFEIYYKEKLSQELVNSLITEIRYLYNFDLDLKDFYEKFKKEKVLGSVIKRWSGLREIKKGEELTISYLLPPKTNCDPCTHKCFCLAKSCKGTMHLEEKTYNRWQVFQKKNFSISKRFKTKSTIKPLQLYPKLEIKNYIDKILKLKILN